MFEKMTKIEEQAFKATMTLLSHAAAILLLLLIILLTMWGIKAVLVALTGHHLLEWALAALTFFVLTASAMSTPKGESNETGSNGGRGNTHPCPRPDNAGDTP